MSGYSPNYIMARSNILDLREAQNADKESISRDTASEGAHSKQSGPNLTLMSNIQDKSSDTCNFHVKTNTSYTCFRAVTRERVVDSEFGQFLQTLVHLVLQSFCYGLLLSSGNDSVVSFSSQDMRLWPAENLISTLENVRVYLFCRYMLTYKQDILNLMTHQ